MKSPVGVSSATLLTMMLSIFFFSCGDSKSHDDKKPRRLILPAGEIHEGWYFAAGDQVVIEGTVNGDAYVAGGLVQVNGTINGDLLVAGGQVNIGGKVSDDIRAAGGAIQCDGNVGKNITVAGGNITIGKSAVVEGNLLAACGSLQFAGTIAHEAKIAAGDMSMTGTINGNGNIAAGNVSILPGARIGGDVHIHVEEKEHAEIADGTVLGKVTIRTPDATQAQRILGFSPWHFWFKIAWACSLLATGLMLTFVFPKQLIGIGSTLLRVPGKSFLWGILGLVLIPIAFALLLATLVGVPLALFVMVLFLWIVYLSQLSLGAALGGSLFGMEGRTHWRMFWALGGGILIVQGLTFIPYVRPIVILAGLILGVGAILRVWYGELQVRRPV